MAIKAFLIGNYWRIPIKNYSNYHTIRVHDVGRIKSNQRLSGINKIKNKWETISWHLNKENIKTRGKTITARNARTQKILDKIRSRYGRIIIKKI